MKWIANRRDDGATVSGQARAAGRDGGPTDSARRTRHSCMVGSEQVKNVTTPPRSPRRTSAGACVSARDGRDAARKAWPIIGESLKDKNSQRSMALTLSKPPADKRFTIDQHTGFACAGWGRALAVGRARCRCSSEVRNQASQVYHSKELPLQPLILTSAGRGVSARDGGDGARVACAAGAR